TLNWTAEILQGDSWFGFDGLSRGSIAAGKSATLSLAGRAGSADRPVGGSYGLIRISDPAASNSPQYVVIVLDQSASTTPVVPDFAPGPLVLSVPTGSAAQTASVRVFVSSRTPVQFYASAVTYEGAAWLTVSPTGTASLTSPGTVDVRLDTRNLAVG